MKSLLFLPLLALLAGCSSVTKPYLKEVTTKDGTTIREFSADRMEGIAPSSLKLPTKSTP